MSKVKTTKPAKVGPYLACCKCGHQGRWKRSECIKCKHHYCLSCREVNKRREAF